MNALEVEHLTVRYGDHLALEDVSLEIPEGAEVAVVGPNGAGKSTLLQAVLGLLRYEGRIRIFGAPADKAPPAWIGYIPQIKTLERSFPALAVELVASAARRGWPLRIDAASRKKAEEALDRAGALRLADRSVSELSGGELQRVFLARSLIRDPRLVLLDEPATGIDVVGEADMYRLLEDYQADTGATFVVITHDWDAAHHHATHVVLLNRELVGFGPPAQALNETCLRRAFGHTGHTHSMHSEFFHD